MFWGPEYWVLGLGSWVLILDYDHQREPTYFLKTINTSESFEFFWSNYIHNFMVIMKYRTVRVNDSWLFHCHNLLQYF